MEETRLGPRTKPVVVRCESCRCVAYCSVRCRDKDFELHSPLCTQIRSESPRPHPTYRRGILFSPERQSPQLVWIRCDLRGASEGSEYEFPHIISCLGIGNNTAQTFQRNSLRKVLFQNRTLEIWFQDPRRRDGHAILSQRNLAIQKVTKGMAGLDWRGPVLFLRKQGIGADPPFYEDIVLSDMRDMIDFLRIFRSRQHDTPDLIMPHGRESHFKRSLVTKGVCINCTEDQRIRNEGMFVQVDVPCGHAVFRGEVSRTSGSLGIPVRALQLPRLSPCRHHLSYEERHGFSANEEASCLFLVVDPTHVSWGRLSNSFWENNVGSVLLVRAGGEDLSVEEAQGLSYYIRHEWVPLYQKGLNTSLSSRQRDVGAIMNPEKFRAWFKGFCVGKIAAKEEKGESTDDWRIQTGEQSCRSA